MHNTQFFVDKAKALNNENILGIAAPYTEDHINSIGSALEADLIQKAYLVGEIDKIKEAINASRFDESKFEIVEASTMEESAPKLMELTLNDVNVIMKGTIDTSILLKSVLNPDYNLRTGKIMAHVSVLFNENKENYYIASDAGVNITTTPEQRKDIIGYCVDIAHNLGKEKPNVAQLAAKEKVYDKMPVTLEAGQIHEMWKNGEIPGCVVSGPLQLDTAVDKESAAIKNVQDPVAGNADILIFPNIEVGNVFVKGLWKMADWRFVGIVAGARLPIVLSSRSDDEEGLLGGIAFACLYKIEGN